MPGRGKKTHCFWNVLEGRTKNWGGGGEGDLRAMVKKKLRNYLTGWSFEQTFRVSKEVAEPSGRTKELLVTGVLSCYRNGVCLSGSAEQRRKGERAISPLCLVEKPDCSLSSSWGGVHFHICSRSRFCRTPAFTILEALSNKKNAKLWVQY